jgi:hypothetical protein
MSDFCKLLELIYLNFTSGTVEAVLLHDER